MGSTHVAVNTKEVLLTAFTALNTALATMYIYMCVYMCVCIYIYMWVGGGGSSVGIATELRAGRSGIESGWGLDFPPVQTGPGAHPASCKMGTGSFPGVKCGRGVHSPPSSAAVMEE